MQTKTTITTTIISQDGVSKPIHWWRIINNLHIKMSLVEMARRVGSTPETLSHLKNSTVMEPRFSLGVQLMALHGLECQEQHNELQS